MEIDSLLAEFEQKDVKFLDLFYADYTGALKGRTVPPNDIEHVLRVKGIKSDMSSVGFAPIERSDGTALPIIKKIGVLPWKDFDSHTEQEFRTAFGPCTLHVNSARFENDPRLILEKYKQELSRDGYSFMIGFEPEIYFYSGITKKDGNYVISYSDNAKYMDMTSDSLSEFKKFMMLGMLEIGLVPKISHPEVGDGNFKLGTGGQHEIEIQYDDMLDTADNILINRYFVDKFARKNGIRATFAPKVDAAKAGSGLHFHISRWHDNVNEFYGKGYRNLSKTALQAVAGIAYYAPDICLLVAPSVLSYKRTIPHHEAPVHICMGYGNRSAMIRIVDYEPFDERTARIEFRLPDSTCNPYLAIKGATYAANKGINEDFPPIEPVSHNVYEANEGLESLPNLEERRDLFRKSKFLKEVLGSAAELYIKAWKKHYDAYFEWCAENNVEPLTEEVTPWEVETYVMRY